MLQKLNLDKLQENLGKFGSKMNSNIYLLAIRDSMLSYMPFTIVASFFMIITYFPIPQVTDFITHILGLSSATVWQSKLDYVNGATLSFGGLYVLIGLCKRMAEEKKTDVMQATLTGIAAFLILTPQKSLPSGNFVKITRLGPQAIFTALIVGIFATVLYAKIDSKGIKIKMPASVPPAVSKPFESLIPMFSVVLVALIFRISLEVALNANLLDLINSTLAKPINGLGGSLIGTLLGRLISNFFWFFGLHGDSMVGGVLQPVWQVLEDQNKVATLSGATPPNIISQSFINCFAGIGWIGASIGMAFFAISKRYKEVGRISLIPHLFNIGEPTVFGIPLMLNFSFFIPMVLSNLISILISYFAIAVNLVPRCTGLAQVPWTTPPIISGFLATGSIRGSILQIVCIAAVTLFWYPFIRSADKVALVEERKIKGIKKERD